MASVTSILAVDEGLEMDDERGGNKIQIKGGFGESFSYGLDILY